MKQITFPDCVLRFEHGVSCETEFSDGAKWGAHPHETPHYHVIAHRCGYGDDLWRYCIEHEFCHHFLKLFGLIGVDVILRLAAGEEITARSVACEEVMVQTFQRWLRANERPIIGGVDWDNLKARALRMLDGA